MPYDRPPLSKQVLAGQWDVGRTDLRRGRGFDDLAAQWLLGRRAVGLDLRTRHVLLDADRALPFDGLVIATGATPRRWPEAKFTGLHVLRTLEDCLALRTDLEAGPRRVVVIGAGFIGAEVAATCRRRGLTVTVLEALPIPLEAALGPVVGGICAEVHRDHGVDLRCGAAVAGFAGDGTGHVSGVELADGDVLDADVVVVGIGVLPNTGWLAQSGLILDNGVVCDDTCLAADGVVAAGDVARWINPRYGELMRLEHWDNATAQGTAAGRRLLAGAGRGEPFAPVPYFWSDQYDTKIQFSGRASPTDEMRLVDGSLEERRFVALYGRDNQVRGVLGFSSPRLVARYTQRLRGELAWDDPAALDPALL